MALLPYISSSYGLTPDFQNHKSKTCPWIFNPKGEGGFCGVRLMRIYAFNCVGRKALPTLLDFDFILLITCRQQIT